ncbi:lytic murein transglycosylase [Rhodoplanes roseus]|uniref:Lytic transglycosylase n=1 Tax=Rhodoplanes roseus TaxID=29409 RepID=A0A327L1M9_9BRAD|nr:lytic murein transglycosylase [Rhodoplanes roseus]RAI44361.1 lytic transglycosylase [Rhodoplanes roseus]
MAKITATSVPTPDASPGDLRRRGSVRRLATIAMLAVSLALPAPAEAQNFLDSLFGQRATGSVTPASTQTLAPGAPGGERPWSGESGSSGHPEMTADAIRAATAQFPACIARLWPEAARRGVSRESFHRYTAGLTPELRLMDLMDAQPEFTKAFWDYLDLLVSDARIKRGREILAQNAATFAAVEKAYGVDRTIVAAIWGVESNFGTQIGDRSVLRSTATLACVGRRQSYFRDEFLAALEILHRGDVVPEHLMGSWAGAFGPTQFMPTSFKRFAVDFDGDGRRDVVDSLPDMIASTANNLKKDGWEAGKTWGYEVVVPQGFNYLMADSSRWLTMQEWTRLGLARANGKPFPRPADKAYLLVPAGRRGPAFLMLGNFRAIMKYNPAEAYAMAIGHLADRMRGDGPIVQPWPRDERVLTSAERYELQTHLVRRGFDIGGEPTGRIGPKSRTAIKRYQQAAGLTPDGFASATLLDQLRSR